MAGADERAHDVAVAVLGRAVQRRLLVRVLEQSNFLYRVTPSGKSAIVSSDVESNCANSQKYIEMTPYDGIHFFLMGYRQIECIRSFFEEVRDR